MENESNEPWGLARTLNLRRRVGPNVVLLGVVSLLNDMSSEMIHPLLPVFVTSVLGVNMAFLGLIEGAAESANSLFKLGAGWLSDRFGRRKPLVLSGYSLASLCRPILAFATAGWHVLALRLGDRVGKGIRTAPRDALIAESVRREDLGVAFGFHRAMDHAGAVAGPLLAIGLLVLLGEDLRLVFLLAALPGVASLAVIAFRVRDVERDDLDRAEFGGSLTGESASAADERAGNEGDRIEGTGHTGGGTSGSIECIGHVRGGTSGRDEGFRYAGDGTSSRDGGFWRTGGTRHEASGHTADGDTAGGSAFAGGGSGGGGRGGSPGRLQLRGPFGVFLVAVALFSLGNSTDAFLLIRLRDLGVPVTLLPAVWVLLSAVKTLSSTPGGYLADRLGRKRVLLAGWAVYAVTYLGFAAVSSAGAAVAVFAFYGVYFGLAEGTEKALVAQLTPAARGTAFGFYHLAVGVTALPASLVFGVVWERLGPETAFLIGAGLAIAAGLVLLAVRSEPQREGPVV